jgi:lipopolysaccharide export system permease protein
MLKILERYLAKTIISATLLTGVIITAILFIMSLLGEFKSLGTGDYGLMSAVYYVILRMPLSLYQFSPMLILLGSIIGLSILSTHRELAVMRASGFSMQHIIYSVFAAALMLILIISFVGEFTGPNLSRRAEMNKDNAQNAGQAVVTSAGVWMHVDNNFIHVDHVVNEQFVEGVTRYEFDNNHRLLSAYFAKSMQKVNKEWIMHDAVKTKFSDNRTYSESFASLPFGLTFNSHLLSVVMQEPSEMSLSRLVKFSRYLESNGLQSSQYRFEFWSRLFTPLASLVMIFLAVPFVLGVFNQAALGWRLVVGVMTGFAFFIMDAFVGQICIVYQVPPILAALIPIIIFGGMGIILAKNLLTT